MAKWQIEVDGLRSEAEWAVTGDEVTLTLPGQTHTATISCPEPGEYLVLLNDRVYRCHDDRRLGAPNRFLVNGHPVSVSIEDRQRRRGSPTVRDGRIELTTPMPGKVVQILVSPGDPVEVHQGILIVEAMKMQNEVQAPRAGRVVEIRATSGQTVPAGFVLAIIE
ncbi:MAG: biotin/lipoyl-containing protein [Blastocatellia bacterium]